ncbi:hypothetical protein N7456_011367 [Penicillium angulare]|uniref:Uncharacterized protein n=1 Tax=Penicillium angulare TaxID=116970 RepID=A0A9W9K041_9EURO|nr:hypothetical protein N7456_011367 [Penicillium angulare]
MEAAPLTLAHTHARNAVLETRKANPVAASEEHDLAAGEFAAAAHNSTDQEALRTLQLLEQHHKKLAEILRFQHEHPAHTSDPQNATASPNLATPSSADGGNAKAGVPSNQDAQSQPPRLPGAPRMLSRESSSIASNLASARGIPSQTRGSPASPTLSAHQAGAKMSEGPSKIRTGEARLRDVPNRQRTNRASTARQPWSPPLPSPTEITAQQVVPSESSESSHRKPKPPAADEPFQRFYSTFEGLISKISAPLAFAGLPLGTGDPGQQPGTSNRKSSAETKLDYQHATSDKGNTLAEPDVNRLFSRAALRSIRENQGTLTGNTAESFYVVPTTGGTMSYAGILTRAEKEARRSSLDEGEDDFVDARETPSSPEMRQSAGSSNNRAKRQGNADKLTSLQNPKTLEELQMENQALKHLSDELSKRLHMWEVNAQSSSMALQQSLRAIHQSPGSHGPSGIPSPVAHMSTAPAMSDSDDRVKELEDIVRRGEQELDRLGRDNDRLNKVLGRYRDRWEKLKEGAKTRRAGVPSADGQSNPPTPVLSSRTPNTPLSPQPDSDSNDIPATPGM